MPGPGLVYHARAACMHAAWGRVPAAGKQPVAEKPVPAGGAACCHGASSHMASPRLCARRRGRLMRGPAACLQAGRRCWGWGPPRMDRSCRRCWHCRGRGQGKGFLGRRCTWRKAPGAVRNQQSLPGDVPKSTGAGRDRECHHRQEGARVTSPGSLGTHPHHTHFACQRAHPIMRTAVESNTTRAGGSNSLGSANRGVSTGGHSGAAGRAQRAHRITAGLRRRDGVVRTDDLGLQGAGREVMHMVGTTRA